MTYVDRLILFTWIRFECNLSPIFLAINSYLWIIMSKTRALNFHFQKNEEKFMNTPAILPSPNFIWKLLKLHQKCILPIYYFALLCVCEIKSNFYFFYIGVMGSCSIIISKNMNFAICSVEWTRTINLKLFTRSILVL